MTQHFHSVGELFGNARDIPKDQRTAWLNANCESSLIRAEVEELLRFDVDDQFLEVPLVKPCPIESTLPHESKQLIAGKLFAGRYKFLQAIGEGGFGCVYMADQVEPVRRRVAIKVLKSSLEKSAIGRFESERQVLAMMDHPNIAKVFDGGVADDGTPYLVMELVNGIPITEFCDANQLPNSQRMELLIAVCNAVQHAHHKGVIHRDLKPNNILVSLLDGVPVPKVIDFGIAKALHGPLTDKTFFTSFQQMIGTPEYMSPEQAETSILDIDTRSDVFSLGVLAYELLTGTTPFDGKQLRRLAFVEMQRTIREVDPPKPSERVSSLGVQAPLIARKHGLNQFSMNKSIRGDLDWIVMKAMEKDRNRRYSSAHSLSEDLRRWMQNEPIEARPPSWYYRTSKYVRKHQSKVLVATVLMVGALLASMGLGFGISERRTSAERQKASELRAKQIEEKAQVEIERSQSLQYGNAMIAANESFLSGRRSTTLELLNACPEGKRGIEWQWLSYRASDQTEVLMEATGKNVQRALTFLPMDHRLLSGGSDGMLRLWSTDRVRELQSWRVCTGSILAMACSNDGSRLLISTDERQLIDWDIQQGVAIAETELDANCNVPAIDIDKNNQRISFAAGLKDGSILCWNGDLNSEPISIASDAKPYREPLQTLEFRNDGSQLLAAGKGSVTLFDKSTGDVVRSYGDDWHTYGAIFAKECKEIVLLGPPVTVVDALRFDNARLIEITAEEVVAACYATQEHALVIATRDQCFRQIDLTSGEEITLGYCHAAGVERIVSARDSHALAFIDQKGGLRLLRSNSRSSPKVYRLFDLEVASIASDGSNQVFGMSIDGELAVVDVVQGVELHRQFAHEKQGFSLAADKSGGKLYSNGLDRKLYTWSLDPIEQKGSYDLALGARYIALHPDGVRLVGPMPTHLQDHVDKGFDLESNQDANLAYWDIKTGRITRCFRGLTNWAMKLRFSKDGEKLAAATISDGAMVWTVNSDAQDQFFEEGAPQVDDVVFSNDMKHLFVAYHNGQVNVWNIETKQIERRIVCHGDQMSGLQVTMDDSRILTASVSDSRVRIWDWRTGQKMAEITSGMNGITGFQLVDEERRMILAGKDGRIEVLDLKK